MLYSESSEDELSIQCAENTYNESSFDLVSDEIAELFSHIVYIKFTYLFCTERRKFCTIFNEQCWYLGLITKVVSSKCVVKFLRKKRKSETELLWSKSDDICTVSEDFIFGGPIDFGRINGDNRQMNEQ